MANTSKMRLPDSFFTRDYQLEKQFGIDDLKLYGYWEDNDSLVIIGQVFATDLKKECCFICSIYDKDGDVIESTENDSYGSGLVTSMIKPKTFFDGFPFKFDLYGNKKKQVKEVRITPADSY